MSGQAGQVLHLRQLHSGFLDGPVVPGPEEHAEESQVSDGMSVCLRQFGSVVCATQVVREACASPYAEKRQALATARRESMGGSRPIRGEARGKRFPVDWRRVARGLDDAPGGPWCVVYMAWGRSVERSGTVLKVGVSSLASYALTRWHACNSGFQGQVTPFQVFKARYLGKDQAGMAIAEYLCGEWVRSAVDGGLGCEGYVRTRVLRAGCERGGEVWLRSREPLLFFPDVEELEPLLFFPPLQALQRVFESACLHWHELLKLGC